MMRFIYCHPLFDERKCAHRFSCQLAKAFENTGLDLERFDYQGAGESDGAFCDITLDRLTSDLHRIVNGDHVCLIGTRLGATIAFNLCYTGMASVHTLILIEPVIDGPHYVEYLLKKQRLKDVMTGNHNKPSDGDFINLEGYKTSTLLIRQLQRLQLFETAAMNNPYPHIRIISVSSTSTMNPDYFRLAERLKNSSSSVDWAHFQLPVFWERIPAYDYSAITTKILGWHPW